MFADYFARSHLLFWPLVGMGIFLATFVIVLARVAIGMKRGVSLDRVASLPLEPDTAGEVDGGGREA